MKVYVVLKSNTPQFVHSNKDFAHKWAENIFGSKTDGLCEVDVEVRAFTDELK